MLACIMVIDDEPNISFVLKELFSDSGHEVVIAEDGKMAFDLLNDGSVEPDIIILDLFMPNLNGRDLLKTIRCKPKFQTTPVILVTGSLPTVESFPPEGSYQDVICKPFDINEVEQKVARLLANSKATPQDLI